MTALGRHNVYNALCAAAIGLAAGLDIPAIQDGLAEFRLPTATVAFIRENLTLYYREGGTDDPAGLVEVYRWTR